MSRYLRFYDPDDEVPPKPVVKLDSFQMVDAYDKDLDWIKEQALASAERRAEVFPWKVDHVELVDQYELRGITYYTFDIYGVNNE